MLFYQEHCHSLSIDYLSEKSQSSDCCVSDTELYLIFKLCFSKNSTFLYFLRRNERVFVFKMKIFAKVVFLNHSNKIGIFGHNFSRQTFFLRIPRLTVLTGFNSWTIRRELDFKSEHLFRMCSVVTNLVRSLEVQPIRCATTLFHFGRTRNGYVATRIIHLSSIAESSATCGYVVAPERSGRSELVETWNGLRKSLVCSQQWI